MKLAQSVAEVLADHVTLEVEGIDRMYLNVYVPQLQCEHGVVQFFRQHRKQPWASSALMNPISRRFVAALERFVEDNGIPVVLFKKGQRKDDVMAERLQEFQAEEGVVFVGKAQEKAPVYRTEKRRNPRTGQSYPWIVKSTALVNHYYFYAVDRDFGPFFLKFCTYFPYNAKLCINGHESAKRQLTRKETAFESLDNGVLSCSAPKRLHNLPKLRETGFAANRRLLEVERATHDCMLAEETFRRINRPVEVRGQRASALRSTGPRVHALRRALLLFRLQPRGLRNADLRHLRLHGMIERIPNSHSYCVTAVGLRAALFFTRSYAGVLRSGLVFALPRHRAVDTPLERAFDRVEKEIQVWTSRAKLAARNLIHSEQVRWVKPELERARRLNPACRYRCRDVRDGWRDDAGSGGSRVSGRTAEADAGPR